MPVPNAQWKTPDEGQGNCPKHVELRTRINLEISASVGFIVKKMVTMHGHMNVKMLVVMNEKLCTITIKPKIIVLCFYHSSPEDF